MSDNFVLIGAGLPRTGTLSTRNALQKLLKGDIYHMHEIQRHPEYHPFWWRVMNEGVSASEWRKHLEDYRGGVDYPISNHYQEIMLAYPNAKVLLNVRDPKRWYVSVRDSIHKAVGTTRSWPISWFARLIGTYQSSNMAGAMSCHAPAWSSSGLGMFQAVEAGEEAAIRFYHDHVNEVKKHVPADRLLVWEAKQGWEPLCKFLGVPVPDEPFPNVNDTQQINRRVKIITIMAWVTIVLVPGAMASTAYYLNFETLEPYMMMAGSYLLGIGILRSVIQYAIQNYGKEKKE